MALELRYGEDSRLLLEVAPEVVLADFASPVGTPLDDPAAAVAAALAHPIEFPPLAQATVSGDRIAIAIDQGVPQEQTIVATVIDELIQSGLEPSDLVIVRAPGARGDVLARVPDSVRSLVRVVGHVPGDAKQLAYLAADKDGRPIYLNRELCDADVVLPIGAVRLEQTWGAHGIHGTLFPVFSDDASRERFVGGDEPSAKQRTRRAEAAEVTWLLGAQFTLQVIPGPGPSLLHVLAGEVNAVEKRAQRLCAAAWARRAPRRAPLVIASIEGGPEQQTWSNLARGVHAALQVVSDGGAIVMCTTLQDAPGPALRRLARADAERLSRQLAREKSPDAGPARLLAAALERASIFLLSALDGATVEELGLGHLRAPADVHRLSRQFDTCIVLGNAQHVAASTED